MKEKKNPPPERPKMYRVFAIYAEIPDNDPIVYVGQSRMKDRKQLLRYYRNESRRAEEFFEPGVKPYLFLLEEEYMPEDVAYRHRIAWSRYFFEKDFDVIAHTKPYEDALDLYGLAEDIYEEISKIPIEEVLQRRYACANENTEETLEQRPFEPLSERLSVRLTSSEFCAFSSFCDRNNVTQREGIQLLLASRKECSAVAEEVIREQNQQIKKLREENAKLKKVPREVSADKNLKEAFQFVQTGILKYFYARDRTKTIPGEKMKCMRWDDFIYDFPDHHSYRYPTEDGYFSFILEAMCYGKGNYSAIFLYGRNSATGERIKLRFYRRNDCCGVSPPNSSYYTEGMCFLIGCRRIYPNVTEMICAFPMVEKYVDVRKAPIDVYDNLDTVQAIIQNAKERSQARE